MTDTLNITTYCETAAKLTFGTWYIWQTILKAVLNSASVVFIIYMFARRLIWIHNEFHGLIGFKLLIVGVYACNNAITHWQPIIGRMVSSDPCTLVFYSTSCLVFKIIQSCCMLSMSTTILLLLIERTLSLHPKITDRFCRRVGRMFVCLEIIFFLIITLEFCQHELNQKWFILHCQQETATTAPVSNVINIIVICIDIPTLCYSVLLKFYCQRQLRNDHQSLQLTYRIRYSLTVVNAFLPVIFFHSAIIAFNNTLGFISPLYMAAVTDYVEKKNLDGLTFIVPYYTVVMPVLYLFALRKLRARREREFDDSRRPKLNGKVAPIVDVYHNKMQSEWEGPATANNGANMAHKTEESGPEIGRYRRDESAER